MANSIINGTGDGSSLTYAINFPLGFLSRDDVQFYVDDELDGSGNQLYRAITWINDGMIQLDDVVANTVPWHITRTVPKTILKHDYTNGEPIEERNLDESFKQTLMSVQEFLDGRFISPLSSNLDAGNNKIVHLANGTASGDSVNKAQLDAVQVIAEAQATAAATSATAAAASAAAALVSQNAAASSSTSATSSATSATSSASAASSSATAAAASYDSFDDRYLGVKSSNPTVDNDGDPLATGTLYYNSVANEMRVYTGSVWKAAAIDVGVTFSAYNSTASVFAANTLTKCAFQTTEWDSGGYYDNATNYRFTPQVAGTYQVNAQVFLTAGNISTSQQYNVVLYKNGTGYKYGTVNSDITTGSSSCINCLVQLNGTTDYIEIYFLNGNASQTVSSNNSALVTFFQAHRVGA